MRDCSGDAGERRAGRRRGGSAECPADVANNNGVGRSARGSTDTTSRRRPPPDGQGGARTAILTPHGRSKAGQGIGATRRGEMRHAASGPHESRVRRPNHTSGRGRSAAPEARRSDAAGERTDRRRGDSAGDASRGEAADAHNSRRRGEPAGDASRGEADERRKTEGESVLADVTRRRGDSAGRRAGPRGRGNSTQRPATEVGRYGRFALLAESDGEEQEIPDLVPDLESEEDGTAGFSVPSLTYWMSLL